ncbi:EamA family transporter [Maridesulfovibrio zosterae]|uniref:EamA family transporter n=1 Tax=Maridesulfovibrio zosterae TaxID=82171 RepID=UPI00041FACC6|nr:EamA family transporter [Maridesulfovibrio zosterae]
MYALYGSIAIAAGSSVIYHIAQKSLSSGGSVFGSLASAYGIAMLVSLAGMFFQTGRIDIGDIASLRNWPVLLLGLAVFGIEIGVLMTYKAGANVNSLPIIVNGVVMACLVPLGALIYSESISINSILGMALIGSGVWLLCSTGHA